MMKPLISLPALLHRLSECPADFLDKPAVCGGVVHTDALVEDILLHLGGDIWTTLDIARTLIGSLKLDENYLRTVQITCWVLGGDEFANNPELIGKASIFLTEELPRLGGVVAADQLVKDPDRREELVRRLLRALELPADGEAPAQSDDRLASLDSVALKDILAESRRKEEHRKRVVEAMRRKAAEEAAAAYGRE